MRYNGLRSQQLDTFIRIINTISLTIYKTLLDIRSTIYNTFIHIYLYFIHTPVENYKTREYIYKGILKRFLIHLCISLYHIGVYTEGVHKNSLKTLQSICVYSMKLLQRFSTVFSTTNKICSGCKLFTYCLGLGILLWT